MNANHLKQLMINDEGFAFDPRAGNTYSLNATGLLAVNAVKAGASPEEIVELLVERHAVDPRTADRDLEDFMNELERNKLIETEVSA